MSMYEQHNIAKKQTSKNVHKYIHILLASSGYPKHLILRYHNFILFAK